MAAAAYKSAAGAAGTGTSPSATFGTAALNDTKVLVVFARSTTTGITLTGIPSGWTERQTWTQWVSGESYVAIYSRPVTTTESAETVTLTLSTSCPWSVAAVVMTGDWDAASVEADSRIGYGATATAPSVTTSTGNTVAVNAVIAVDYRAFDPPVGTTEVSDITNGGATISQAIGYKAITASGATGTFAWTFKDRDTPANTLAAVGRAVTFAVKANAVTSVTLSGGGTIPSGEYSYATSAITASPTTISVNVAAPAQTITIVDQNSVPVQYATVATSNATVCQATGTDDAGKSTAIFGNAGTATLTYSYIDGMSSLRTATVSVTVAAVVVPPTTSKWTKATKKSVTWTNP